MVAIAAPAISAILIVSMNGFLRFIYIILGNYVGVAIRVVEPKSKLIVFMGETFGPTSRLSAIQDFAVLITCVLNELAFYLVLFLFVCRHNPPLFSNSATSF